jgi:hypothetical protein
MNTLWIVVCLLVALVLMYRIVMFALKVKGEVDAGAQIGGNSFYIRVKDQRQR